MAAAVPLSRNLRLDRNLACRMLFSSSDLGVVPLDSRLRGNDVVLSQCTRGSLAIIEVLCAALQAE
jgi:hypothetical protein